MTLRSYLHIFFVVASFALLCDPSFAHNQSPATIRRAMEKAFKAFDVAAPSNVLRGTRTVRASGTTAQVFDVKKDGKLAGVVAQLEFREQTHVVAFDAAGGKVKTVIRDGSALDEEEWKELPFIAPLTKELFETK